MWKRGSGWLLAAFLQVLSRLRLLSGSELWVEGVCACLCSERWRDFADRDSGVASSELELPRVLVHRTGVATLQRARPDRLLPWGKEPATFHRLQMSCGVGSVRVPRPNI